MSVRPDPFEQMEAMFEQMRRSALGSWPDQSRPALTGRPRSGTVDDRMTDVRVSIEESDDGYVVMADLPGFERDEIELGFEEGYLTIAGTHEESDDEQYRTRSVQESVRIPGDVIVEDATATYHNGVLEVTLPVDEESTDGYRIDIE